MARAEEAVWLAQGGGDRIEPTAAHDSPPSFADRPARFGFAAFLPELLRHKREWLEVLAASLVLQGLGLVVPLLTQVVVDKVVVHQTYQTLVVVAAALALATLFSGLLAYARQAVVLHAGTRVDAVMTARVFGQLLGLPVRYFEARATGVTVARLQAVETVRHFLAGAATALVLDAPFMLVFLALMLWYSWQLTLIACTVLTAIALLSAGIAPLFRRRLDRQFLAGARNQAFVTEYLAGIDTVKSLQMEPQLAQRFDALLAGYLEASYSTRRLANGYQSGVTALEQAQGVALLCVGALLVMRADGFTVGMLIAFQMLASRFAQPLMRLVGMWQEFQQAGIAVRRLGDIMDAPAEPRSAPAARESTARVAGGTVRIAFRGVGFRYADNQPFLYRGLNLDVAPGSFVVVLGPSGSGKSTLLKLLQGHRLPSEGSITVNGVDILHLGAEVLRATFGVVPQEVVLFSGTVYENLLLGSPDAGMKDAELACQAAAIHQTLTRLPQGYHTVLGEHGAGLSGGQKQRIAIARALLRRAPVLVLDEPTSSLDAQSQGEIEQTLARLRGHVSVLLIAHALPRTVRPDAVVHLQADTTRQPIPEET